MAAPEGLFCTLVGGETRSCSFNVNYVRLLTDMAYYMVMLTPHGECLVNTFPCVCGLNIQMSPQFEAVGQSIGFTSRPPQKLPGPSLQKYSVPCRETC